jgi:hypothetical protein
MATVERLPLGVIRERLQRQYVLPLSRVAPWDCRKMWHDPISPFIQ